MTIQEITDRYMNIGILTADTLRVRFDGIETNPRLFKVYLRFYDPLTGTMFRAEDPVSANRALTALRLS